MAPALMIDDDDGDQETKAAFHDALEAFKQRCSQRHLERFGVMSSREVKYEIVRIQRDQERLKAMLNLRRLQKFLQKLEELQLVLQRFLDAGSYLSYVWGVMQFLLSNASSTFQEGLDSLLDAYEALGKKMPSVRNLECLFTKHTGMRRCLSALYKDILDFHAGSYQCFTQFSEKGRKKIFKSAWKDFEYRITFYKTNLEAQKDLIDLGSRLLEYQRSSGCDNGLDADGVWKLSDKVLSYEGEKRKRAQEFEEKEKDHVRNQFNEAVRWVSGGLNTSEDTHNDRCNVRGEFPETCDWIKKNDAVDNWMTVPTPTHSILWINGGMGAGKSTLASYLIDQCMKCTSAGAPFKTIYFYCKGKDPESSTCLALFKGLLHQQLMHIRNDDRFRHLIAYCSDKKDQSGQPGQQLNTFEVAKSLLELFFEVIPYQYIIVDGIDECERPEIKQSLPTLTAVVARQDNTEPGRLRLLVISRDMPEIKRPLSSEATTANIIKIEPKDNEEAISKYVSQRVAKFSPGFNLTKNEIERIRDLTCNKAKGAQGMFLFAELVLNNLEQSIQKELLLKELDTRRFPQNLEQAYDRIIDGIRKNQDEVRWEKTKSIFGWLICAGRILRWHEIQAIVSIEMHHQSVEFNQKKFIPDVQELCGTLVHVKPGDKVELIHHTAHDYILKNHSVKKSEVQFDLATLCMQYLTFPCFEKRLPPPIRTAFAKDGFYAFQDYAVSKWFYHISEVVSISSELLSIDAAKSEKFANVLDDFIHRYQESIEDRDSSSRRDDELASPSLSSSSPLSSSPPPGRTNTKDVEENAKKQCESLKNTPFYPMLLNLWIHIQKHEKEHINDRNKPSLKEMEDTLTKNRGVIETLFDAVKGGEDGDRLVEYYGKNIFKCPKTRCGYFYEGFSEAKKRDHHINRHERPFECTIEGCGIGGAGFISGKDLERHKKNYHMNVAEGPVAFPQLNKKKNNEAKFDCPICGQKFTRKINLTGHTRSHFGERPFQCQNCGKKFTRVNDLRRHEKLHLRK